jgi:hypothetical protein
VADGEGGRDGNFIVRALSAVTKKGADYALLVLGAAERVVENGKESLVVR